MHYDAVCSFYFSVFEKHAAEMTLEELVRNICDGRWRAQVEEYQRLMASGKETEAKKWKRKLPALVVAGRCRGSHAEGNLEGWSGDAMLDVDHPGGQVDEFLALLERTEWVKAAWRSVSYDGLKLVVRVEAENTDEYRLAYAVVAWHVEQLLHFPCDMSCKNPTRPCFVSYDPRAFFRADTAVFPWRKFVEEHPDRVKEILADLKVNVPAPRAQTPLPDGQAVPRVAPPPPGILRAFFNEFLDHNPFMDGKKNEFLLRLGRVARYKGITPAELEQLKALAVERLAGEDCPAADIPPRMDSGYRYADTVGLSEKPSSRVHKVQGPPTRFSGPWEDSESAEEEKFESDKLRREVPYLPDDLFDRLPQFLKRGLIHVRNRRERDILLLSMIANISGCLPGVRMNYGGMLYSADLYLIVLAGSGRGKGVMQLAALLPGSIQEYYDELNRKDAREYKQKLMKWNLEERMAVQEKRVPNLDLCPEEPVRRVLKVAPNISKSQLILALEAAGPIGLVMNASELDMVSSAMRQEYGKHDDVLRAVSQHEEVSSFFKTDHRLVVASDPHMALCASGTPAQLRRFISSMENGMYSRVSFYIGQAAWSYKSANPGKNRLDMRAYFKEMSDDLLRMFIFLSGSPTEVLFTEAQWEEHTDRFRTHLHEVVAEDDDSPGAIVLRHGLMDARIAMVLTALRKCEPQWNTPEWTCTDEDFRTAMQIADVLLEHSLLFSTSMHAPVAEVRHVKPFFRVRSVLDELPSEFTYSEWMEKAAEKGISSTSAKRYLLRLQELQIIVKEGNKYKKVGAFGSKKPPK